MTAINTLLKPPPRINPTVTVAPAAAEPVVSDEDAQPNYLAIYGSTIFAVALLFLFGVGLPASMVYGNTTGWAIGAFCAIWGGPSFGVMAGSARLSFWEEKHGHA